LIIAESVALVFESRALESQQNEWNDSEEEEEEEMTVGETAFERSLPPAQLSQPKRSREGRLLSPRIGRVGVSGEELPQAGRIHQQWKTGTQGISRVDSMKYE
jgi:hypothetical protein